VSIFATENERNARSADLFKAIITEVYGADNIGIGHHLMFSADGQVDEQPSVDTLIFDHEVAQKLWPTCWKTVLVKLALEPQATRDAMLADLYHNRSKTC
jgi:hypothetical protein